jgi:hypothetical protein
MGREHDRQQVTINQCLVTRLESRADPGTAGAFHAALRLLRRQRDAADRDPQEIRSPALGG